MFTPKSPRGRLVSLLASGACALLFSAALCAADLYILPEARGSGDGSSWENAAAAPTEDGWTARIADLEPGDTLRIGSGVYPKAAFSMSAGGAAGAPITVLGEDTGAGLPVFRGTWNKDRPASGQILCNLSIKTSFVTLKNLRVENYMAAVVTSGGNQGIVISGIEGKDVRFGAVFKNAARADLLSTWTRDVLVENCTFTGFTKSALRWEGGNRDFRIVNVHGDAGGKPYATDPFHMVFDIRGDQRRDLPPIIERVHDRDFTFIGCTARNAWHEPPPGKKYWNGDGYVAERGVSNLTFIDCMAFDCTDGGWDLKATGVTFKGCVAFRNKRNYRIWNDATFENCIGGYPIKRGGSGGAHNIGVYGDARLKLAGCTLVGDAAPFGFEQTKAGGDPVRVNIADSLIVSIDGEPAADGPLTRSVNSARLSLAKAPKGTVFIDAPGQDWDGKGKGFNASPAQGGKGFRRL